jgi:hypothetical protein
MDTLDERAEKALDVARKIKAMAETPRPAFSAEHAAAQNALVAMGLELAEIVLGER